MVKMIISFIIFAGVIYYYNIDIIRLVEKSGAPEWLAKKGFVTKNPSVVSTSTEPIIPILP